MLDRTPPAPRRLAVAVCLSILAACGGGGAKQPPAPTIQVDPSAGSLHAGDAGVALTATVTNFSGAPAWTLTGPGALSASSGASVVYTAPADLAAAATATVTATADTAHATATFGVAPRPVVDVRVGAEAAGCLLPAGLLPLDAVVHAAGGFVTAQPVTWASSDEAVAKVSAAGVVTAVAPGTAGITATAGGVPSAAFEVWVHARPAGLVTYSAADGANGKRQVHLLSLDGAQDDVLAEGWNGVLSPDANLVTYQRGGTAPGYTGFPNRYDSVYVWDRTSAKEYPFFSNPASYVNTTSWTADQQVLFDYDAGLEVAPPTGKGAAYAYTANGRDDGFEQNPVDGRYAFWNDGGPGPSGGVFTVDSKYQNRKLVPGTVPSDGWHRWAPDGARLSYLHQEATAGQFSVLVVNPDTAARTDAFLATGADDRALGYPASWTLDGQWLIAAARVGGVQDLWAFAADGSGCKLRVPVTGGATADFVGPVRAPSSPRAVALTPSLPACVLDPTPVQLTLALTDALGVALPTPAGTTYTATTQNVTVSAAGLVTPTASGAASVEVKAGGLTATAAMNVALGKPKPAGRLAYSALGGVDGAAHEVRIAQLDGSADVLVAQGWNPRESPDGTLVSYQRGGTYPSGTGDWLYAYDLAGATPSEHLLFQQGDYVVSSGWSPDSQQVLFDYFCEIDHATRTGASRAAFVTGNCYDDAPDARLTDGLVAFHNQLGGGGIITIQPNGTGRALVPNTVPFDYYASWSHDGAWLSYAHTVNSVWIPARIKPDGTGKANLVAFAPDAYNHAKVTANPWTPDGEWVVTVLVRGDAAAQTTGIWAVSSDGSGCMVPIRATRGATADFVGTVR